jgi:RNA polymerase sigma-70 factor, ECF subfamily
VAVLAGKKIARAVKSRARKLVYTASMQRIATSGFIAASMENPVTEIQDFDRVVELYWPRILRFILASVHDADIAETLTQDCFWNAYQSRQRFRGDASLNTWLMRIAVNLVRDFGRNRRLQFWKKTNRTAVDSNAVCDWLPDRSLSPEDRAAVNERVRAVWDATKDLSERQRTVFLLRFVEDMDIIEIAGATGLSANAVHVHLFRAVRAIRKRVGNHNE